MAGICPEFGALFGPKKSIRAEENLFAIKPDTVIRGHRRGFRAYWRWKPRRGFGRPRISGEIRRLYGG
jgi:hypothetical protein